MPGIKGPGAREGHLSRNPAENRDGVWAWPVEPTEWAQEGWWAGLWEVWAQAARGGRLGAHVGP